MTLAELASRIDASATHLSQIETGKVTNPGVELLSRIAGVLGAKFLVVEPEKKPAQSALPSMVYASPFTLEELARSEVEDELLRSIDELLRDETLNRTHRESICAKVLSYLRWLREEPAPTDQKRSS